jgi:hypothetical protein
MSHSIQGLGFMLVPLSAAVPLAVVEVPPLLASRAPGLREFLNCWPLKAAFVVGVIALRWLAAMFEVDGFVFEFGC